MMCVYTTWGLGDMDSRPDIVAPDRAPAGAGPPAFVTGTPGPGGTGEQKGGIHWDRPFTPFSYTELLHASKEQSVVLSD